MNGPRPALRAAALPILGAALTLLGPAATTARAQWFAGPGYGFGVPVGGFGAGGFYGGFGYGGFGYGYPVAFGVPAVGIGPGPNPYAFSPLYLPSVQSGLAYNALATGRLAPFTYGAVPFGYGAGPIGFGGPYGGGFGPLGYGGAAFYNPYFASGLTPLAVQSALEQQVLSRALAPNPFQVAPIIIQEAPPAEPAASPEARAADPAPADPDDE